MDNLRRTQSEERGITLLQKLDICFCPSSYIRARRKDIKESEAKFGPMGK